MNLTNSELKHLRYVREGWVWWVTDSDLRGRWEVDAGAPTHVNITPQDLYRLWSSGYMELAFVFTLPGPRLATLSQKGLDTLREAL